MCPYLTVASCEALAAGAHVLPVLLRSAGGGQGQAQSSVEAGSAFAGVRERCGPGRSGLRRGRGVRSQLEIRGDGLGPTAKEQEGAEKQRGRMPPLTHPDQLFPPLSPLSSELLLELAGLRSN